MKAFWKGIVSMCFGEEDTPREPCSQLQSQATGLGSYFLQWREGREREGQETQSFGLNDPYSGALTLESRRYRASDDCGRDPWALEEGVSRKENVSAA